MLGSEQLDLPEWLGVPLRQIPPEYEYNHANFNSSAFPHSCMWYYNYMIVRERPGLRQLTLEEKKKEEEVYTRPLPLTSCREDRLGLDDTVLCHGWSEGGVGGGLNF